MNAESITIINAFYNKYVNNPETEKTQSSLIKEYKDSLKQIVSKIEQQFNDEIEDNWSRYKCITEDEKYYMLKGSEKAYFKRYDISSLDDLDNLDKLEQYFDCLDIAYVEDNDDNIVIAENIERAPLVNKIFEDIQIGELYSNIKNLKYQIDNPEQDNEETANCDVLNKMVSILKILIEKVEILTSNVQELSDRLDDAATAAVDDNESVASVQQENEESDRLPLLKFKPSKELTTATDEFIKSITAHDINSSERFIYKRTLSITCCNGKIKDVIKNRLKELHWHERTGLPGKNYSKLEKGNDWYGYVSNISTFPPFPPRLKQITTENTDNICASLRKFYTALYTEYTQHFNDIQCKIPRDKIYEYIECFSKEMSSLSALCRRADIKYKNTDEEAFYNSVCPIFRWYVDKKINLLSRVVKYLQNQI